jgi:serine/threonine protein kinase
MSPGALDELQGPRQPRAGTALPVMFQNEHVDELRPRKWRKQSLGSGGSGTVHEASWRGVDVAVKVFKLPQEQANMSADARRALQAQLQQLTSNFTTEVEICCDLNHPNLVRFLGYATKPQLFIVQELMRGKSLDQQLYIEKWRPSTEQTRKIALDVANGIKYLHTAFQDSAQHEQAILHRDLKSPNLLLQTPPDPSGEVGDLLVKISDFGLSKDKKMDSMQHTIMMTAVGNGMQGTTLWMAPEMLLGEAYNEKVDVCASWFCLCRLPMLRILLLLQTHVARAGLQTPSRCVFLSWYHANCRGRIAVHRQW